MAHSNVLQGISLAYGAIFLSCDIHFQMVCSAKREENFTKFQRIWLAYVGAHELGLHSFSGHL